MMDNKEIQVITRYIGVWAWFIISFISLSWSLFYFSEFSVMLKAGLSITFLLVCMYSFYETMKRRKYFNSNKEEEEIVIEDNEVKIEEEGGDAN